MPEYQYQSILNYKENCVSQHASRSIIDFDKQNMPKKQRMKRKQQQTQVIQQYNPEKMDEYAQSKPPRLGNSQSQSLIAIVTQIAQSLASADSILKNYSNMGKVYKKMSQQLAYFVKLLQYGIVGTLRSQFLNKIRQCLNQIRVVLCSTEYERYCHRFPLFQHLVRLYQRFMGQEKAGLEGIDQQKVIGIVEINQGQQNYRIFGLDAIQPMEKKFLEDGKATKFFALLMEKSVILHNSQCILCSQVFIKNFKVFNVNPLIPVVIDLNEKKGFDAMTLERYVNAVCNNSGGVIVIGLAKKSQHFIVVGINFKSREQILEREAEIQRTIQAIQPTCIYQIERVLVHTNYIAQTNSKHQFMRICLRILIFPQEPKRISYFQISNKGYHNIYEVYKLDSSNKPVKVISSTANDINQSIYTMMLQKYDGKKPLVNSHQGINCFRPYPDYSIFYNEQYAKGFMDTEQKQQEVVDQQSQNHQEHMDEPKFKFQNTSLLIVGSKKHERHINDFEKLLRSRKQIFDTQKPFTNSFKEGVREVTMMTHKMNFIQLKSLQKTFQAKHSIKPGIITMMPVYNTLEIQKSKYKENQAYIQKKFTERYHQLYIAEMVQVMDSETKMNKMVYYLHFRSYNEAIYAYMIFEKLGLRPYFTKDGNNGYIGNNNKGYKY